MNKQPEALRLADWCDANSSGIYRPSAEAAAELRRLYEENQRLRGIVPEVLERLNDELCDENELLKAQRDALLEALKYHQEQTRPIQRSIDAIKAVEENK